MDKTILSILIVTYNSAGEIANLLTDLGMVYPIGRVIVIDNASIDQTVDIITRQYPKIHLVQNSDNLGYAKAMNQGIEICDTSYVLLLNPDIRIPVTKVITEMLNLMDSSPKIGATGPLQYMIGTKGKRLNFICSYWGRRAFIGYIYHQIYHRWSSPNPIRVPLLNAGCVIIRRSAFIKMGKFNPKYFLCGEDPDLGMKLKRFGYELWLLPNIFVIHFREKSLQTLSAKQRLLIRWHAIWNIADAFWNGWRQIILDKRKS